MVIWFTGEDVCKLCIVYTYGKSKLNFKKIKKKQSLINLVKFCFILFIEIIDKEKF